MSNTTTAADVAVPTSSYGRVERLYELSDDLIESFLTIYRGAFAPLETLAPCRQSLYDDEFREEMRHDDVLKWVAWDGDEPVALSFMTMNLERVPWISVPYFRERFPEQYARSAIYYFGALLVRPERQGGPWIKIILDDIVTLLGEDRAIAAFDCCGFNSDVVKLPAMIARVSDRLTVMEPHELDRQSYYGFEYRGLLTPVAPLEVVR